MSYTGMKLAGVAIEKQPGSIRWSQPTGLKESPLVGGGAVVSGGKRQSNILLWNGDCTATQLKTLMQVQELERAVSLEDDFLLQRWTSGKVFGYIEDIEPTAQAGYVTGTRRIYPYTFRFRAKYNADDYKRSSKFNITNIANSYSLTPKPVIALPLSTTDLSQTATGTRTTKAGAMGYIANPAGSDITYTADETKLEDDSNIVISKSGTEDLLYNGMIGVRSRVDEVSEKGALDLYCYDNVSAYSLLARLRVRVYDGVWRDLAGQRLEVTPAQWNDREYGLWVGIWEQFTSGTALLGVLEAWRGHPYLHMRLWNIGTTNILAHELKLDQLTYRYLTRYGSTLDATLLSPVSMVTNTNNAGIGNPQQRHLIQASGLYWWFYSDGTNLVYQTSGNGSTWSAATTIRACTTGRFFGVCYDGAYGHYVYAAETANTAMYYRRFTFNSDGTVTYSAAEATAVAAVANTYYTGLTICTDSLGYVYVGYGLDLSGSRKPYVTKNSLQTGAWTAASGFPYNLSATAGATTGVLVVPVIGTSGAIYALYGPTGATVKGKLWSAGAWGSEETVSTSNYGGIATISAVNIDSDVYVVFLDTANSKILFVKRSAGAWSAEATVADTLSATSSPVLTLATNRDLYAFWLLGNHVYYKKYDYGTATWDTNSTDWITGTAFKSNDRISSPYTGPVLVVYSEANGDSNIDMKLALLIDEANAGADDRNYASLHNVSPVAANTITLGIIDRTRGNDRQYVADKAASNWTSIIRRYGHASNPVTPGAWLQDFWVFLRKYENANDAAAELAAEAMCQVDVNRVFKRVT